MTSFPKKFVERMQEILPRKEVDDFFKVATEPLPKTIRTSANFSKPKNWTLTPVAEIPEAFFITRENQSEVPLGHTLEHFSGKIYVASLSSLLAVHVLDPKPEEKILDLCAAPGSKTTFMAERMRNSGVIVANEPSSSRSMKLVANLDRMGVMNTIVLQNDGSRLNTFFVQEFDKILLDAPCSSEGFGRKSADFFEKMWAERKIFEAAKLQKKLILAAFEMLAPGGEMVYSTCTSAPEENEAVVQFLLDQFPDAVELVPIEIKGIPHKNGVAQFFEQKFSLKISNAVVRLYPHLRNEKWNSEIFFLAKIRKPAPLPLPNVHKEPLSSVPEVLGKNQTATFFAQWKKHFGLDSRLFEDKVLFRKNDRLFLASPEAASLAVKIQHRRCGLPVLDQHGNMTSDFAIHFGSAATQGFFELTASQAARWLAGYDLPLEEIQEEGAEILVRFESFCLGHGKVCDRGKKLKNKLDRKLVFSL